MAGAWFYWVATLLLGVLVVVAVAASLPWWATGIAFVDVFAYWRFMVLCRRAERSRGIAEATERIARRVARAQ